MKILLIIFALVILFSSCKVTGETPNQPTVYIYKERIPNPPYYRYYWEPSPRRIIIVKHKHR